MTVRFLVGTVFERLADLPDDSVDLILTSPPFLALRSYLQADHPTKDKEIGSEPTPGEFIDSMLDVVEALDRVLAPHGSICFELGDTYSGSGGAGGDYGPDGMRGGQEKFTGSALANRKNKVLVDGRLLQQGPTWPLDKSLCQIPESFRWALSYGRNPFTGRSTSMWRVRNVVRWYRPNPPVGALGDKFRPATSDMVIACKSKTRFFDLDAVREPASKNTNARLAKGVSSRPNECKTSPDGNRDTLAIVDGDGTRPPYDTWIISTAPYKGSHYATFPPELCVKPILSMCPERVCRTCGEPSRRIVETEGFGERIHARADGERTDRQDWNATRPISTTTTTTTGWSTCGHGDWRSGIVLDPFGGSGTVGEVASRLGRDAILIDIDERNAELAIKRVGAVGTLTVESDGKVSEPIGQEAML